MDYRKLYAGEQLFIKNTHKKTLLADLLRSCGDAVAQCRAIKETIPIWAILLFNFLALATRQSATLNPSVQNTA